MDPALAGLLEGAAFMAARVQLKLKSEFSEFTSALLDQLLPNYLAPIPSALLVRAEPDYGDNNLAAGVTYPAGSYLDAVYVEQERRVSCRYRLASDLTLWPLRVEKAEYFVGPAPPQALGLEVLASTAADCAWSSTAAPPDPRTTRREWPRRARPSASCRSNSLRFHLVGNATDTIALYEQLFANCRRITIRYLDSFGDPKFVAVPPDALQQAGFDGDDERLFGHDDRVFAGFELLREFFAFPQMFLGFRLEGLRRLLSKIEAHSFEVLFEFDTALARLAPLVNREHVRAACRAGSQPVRDELQPHPAQARRARASRGARPQPLAGFRGAPHHRRLSPIIPATARRSASSRSTACRPGNVRLCRRAVLHRAPAAAPADGAGAALRSAQQLHRHRTLLVAARAGRHRRRRARAASSASGRFAPTGT